jgi:hypothetical protein
MSDGGFSDLIGAELAVWLILWFLAILGAFFFIGPVVGIIVVVIAVVLSTLLLIRAIRRADES